MSDDEFMTVEELAQHCRVAVRTVYWWNRRGTAPTRVRLGRAVRYRRSDVEAWLASSTVKGGAK